MPFFECKASSNVNKPEAMDHLAGLHVAYRQSFDPSGVSSSPPRKKLLPKVVGIEGIAMEGSSTPLRGDPNPISPNADIVRKIDDPALSGAGPPRTPPRLLELSPSSTSDCDRNAIPCRSGWLMGFLVAFCSLLSSSETYHGGGDDNSHEQIYQAAVCRHKKREHNLHKLNNNNTRTRHISLILSLSP